MRAPDASGGSAGEPGQVETRPPTVADAADLALAHVRAWQGAYRGLMPQEFLDGLDVDEWTEGWRSRLPEPTDGSEVIAGAVGGRVVGFALFGPARDAESAGCGELWALNVHPDYWASGVGQALLVAAQRRLAAAGFRDAVLWVVPGNARARRFYERNGWVEQQVERTLQILEVTVSEVRYARALP